MTDEEIISALRRYGPGHSPVQAARELDRLLDGGLAQSSLVTYFRQAFPAIPLRALLDAGAWHRISTGGAMSDEDLDAHLGRWWPGAGAAPGWHPDPAGRHQYRWWDGSTWTDRVADGGQDAVDPLP
jgi:hypothetical protein